VVRVEPVELTEGDGDACVEFCAHELPCLLLPALKFWNVDKMWFRIFFFFYVVEDEQSSGLELCEA
jgi:hypothetical protein